MAEPIGRFVLTNGTTSLGVVPFQYISVTTVSHPLGYLPFGSRLQILRQSVQFGILRPDIDVVLWAELDGTSLGATTIVPIATPFGWTSKLFILSPNVKGLTIDVNGVNNTDLTWPV